MGDRILRAGIVGAGLMGRWHAHALARSGGQVVAVVDPNESHAQRLAQKYGARAYTSLDQLLTQTAVDVLHVCTPLATHAELATRGLEAGAHVLVEKPLTPDEASTAQLLEAARTSNRLIVPVHQFIFQNGVQRSLARLREIAPLVHLDFTITTAGGEKSTAAERNALIADILPHPLGLFYRILPDRLEGIEWQALHPAPGELRATGDQNGLSVSITLSTQGRPTRNALTLIGERGTFYIDLFHGFGVLERGGVSRTNKLLQPFAASTQLFAAAALNLAERAVRRESAYPGLRELVRLFYDAIKSGAEAPILPREIVAIACERDRLMAQAHLNNL